MKKQNLVIDIPAKDGVLVFTHHGTVTKRSIKARKWTIPERGQRGKITTFSRHSARRLRDSLNRIPSKSGIYGITLTFKESVWKNDLKQDPEVIRAFFNALMYKMRVNAKKGFISKLFFAFWRVELQKNKTPHFHLVIHTPDVKDILIFRDAFFRTVLKRFGYGAPDNAFDMRELIGSDAFNYICSHASKHKKEQLGWQGKQWGLVFPCKEAKEWYKKCSALMDNASYGMSREKETKLYRIFRKMHWAKLRCRIVPTEERKKIIMRQHLPYGHKDKLPQSAWAVRSKNAPKFYCMGIKNKKRWNDERFASIGDMIGSPSSIYRHFDSNNKCSKLKIKRGSLRFFAKRLSSVSSQFVAEDTIVKLKQLLEVKQCEL